jgi:hypothetical protein
MKLSCPDVKYYAGNFLKKEKNLRKSRKTSAKVADYLVRT